MGTWILYALGNLESTNSCSENYLSKKKKMHSGNKKSIKLRSKNRRYFLRSFLIANISTWNKKKNHYNY